jgi:hypothetical protein
MATPNNHHDFHILDEFVCDANASPIASLAYPAKHGQNEGMTVVEELVFEPSGETTDQRRLDDERHGITSHILNRADEFGMARHVQIALSVLRQRSIENQLQESAVTQLAKAFASTGQDKTAPESNRGITHSARRCESGTDADGSSAH